MRPVSVSEIGVSTKVDNEEIDDELSDLHGGQVSLPPDLGASSCTEVVVIHKDVYCQIKDDRYP